MALKMHRYFKDDENLGAVRAYLDKCRDGILPHYLFESTSKIGIYTEV